MTLHEYLVAIRKNWMVILICGLIGAAAGFGYAQTQPDSYRAEVQVVVSSARGDSTTELVQGSNYVQGLVQTYAVVARSPLVLDPVIKDLDLDTTSRSLRNQVTVEAPLDTAVLSIAVTGGNPEGITRIANAIASELAVAVADLSPQTNDSVPAVRIETISPATEPSNPVGPNTRLLIVAGALAGLVAGLLIALLRRLLATRLQSRDDVAAITEAAVLGEVPSVNSEALPSTVRRAETGRAAESMRSIAAGLRFANVDREARVLLVTSATSGEGKSSIALALALVIADLGQRVLIIDADLRRGTIASLAGIEGEVGLTSVLVADTTLDQAVQEWGSPNLSILTAGTTPPNPSQLLTSEHLRQVVSQARETYDLVIIDSPPVLAVSDPMWLARAADGILVVARDRFTRREALRRTLDELETTRTPVLGVIVNAVRRLEKSAYSERESTSPRGPSILRLGRDKTPTEEPTS